MSSHEFPMKCPICQELMYYNGQAKEKYSVKWACYKNAKHSSVVYCDNYYTIRKGHLKIVYDNDCNITYLYIGDNQIKLDCVVKFEDSYKFLIKYLRLKAFS